MRLGETKSLLFTFYTLLLSEFFIWPRVIFITKKKLVSDEDCRITTFSFKGTLKLSPQYLYSRDSKLILYFILFFCSTRDEPRASRMLGKHSTTKPYPQPQSYFLLIYFLWNFETGSHYITQADIQHMIFLPQSPKCWDHRHVASCPAQSLLSKKGKHEIKTQRYFSTSKHRYCCHPPPHLCPLWC
jgi:hypothetical protein